MHRLLDSHGVPAARGPGQSREVPAQVVEAITREIGAVPRRRSGLTREAVLAARVISHAPLGVRSARALARLIGSSPTTASKVLRDLRTRGLVTQRTRTVASGRAVEVTEWVARDLGRWPQELLADVKAAALPVPPARKPAEKVPPRFHHLFWNVDVRALTLPADAAFVASRLLAAPDLAATAWALTELPYEALEKAMSSRSFQPRDQWLLSHLHHRLSRDLDFFTDGPFDAAELAGILRARGSFAVTDQSDGTLNGVFEHTKVQFLDASTQRPLRDFTEIDGVRIASLPDLLATKVKVIADRGELRDYFDLMVIEERTDLTVEEGLVLFVDRYRPASPESAVSAIVRGLGYLDDVNDDPGLPVGRSVVEAYWWRRAPEIVRWFADQTW